MLVRKDDILAIKPGRSKAFVLDRPQAVNNAKVMVTYVKNMGLVPDGVATYKVCCDYPANTIVITAVKKEDVL